MPTTRPRHVITETDPVAAALDDAARRWPEDRESRSKLLVRLVEEGHQAIRGAAVQRRGARLEAIRQTGGSLTGVYGADYLDELRRDWDE
jgi:hypothetical protein